MGGALHTQRYATLRERLIEARRNAGLTQTQVAEQLGRPQSFVAKYELGERRLDIIEFLDVAHVLKLNVGLFLAKL